MEQGKITCPNCGEEFEMSDALTGRIREHLRGELLKEVSRREGELKKKTAALKVQEELISKSREAIDEEIETKLKERLADAEKKAARKLEGQYADQFKDLQGAIEEKDAAIKAFRDQELELRKKQRKLEEATESLELDVARKLDEERERIRGEAEKKIGEAHRLKDLEKDKVIHDLMTSLEDMKRKAEQGSMETQGEVLEQDFEAQLKSFFVHDDIQPVPKGIRGADLIQTVRTTMGAESGVLLWETKNTKAWSSAWIPKLKDDMIEVRASIAILVSVVLPDGINRFGQVDGLWVSDPLSAIPLAAVEHHEAYLFILKVKRMGYQVVLPLLRQDFLRQQLPGRETPPARFQRNPLRTGRCPLVIGQHQPRPFRGRLGIPIGLRILV